MNKWNTSTGIDKYLADPAARRARLSWGNQLYRTLERLESVFVIEGSILEPCYAIWK
jgi:hypothetical protein